MLAATCRRSSQRRSAARPSPPPSKAASATASTSVIRAICATIRRSIASDVLVALPMAAPSRWARWRPSRWRRGPTTIRTENGQLVAYIYVDIRDRDLGGYVADAQKAVAASGTTSAGLSRRLEWPVRISAACRGAAENCRSGDALDHLSSALLQFPRA